MSTLWSDCSPTLRDFFADCPWGRIPIHRQADIVMLPSGARQGLLGGASKEGKVSKLAALAAKRRQREPEKPEETSGVGDDLQHGYTSRLDNLSLVNSSTGGSSRTPAAANSQQNDVTGEAMDVDLEGPALTEEPVIAHKRASNFASVFDDSHRDPDESIEPVKITATIQMVTRSKELFDFTTPSPDDIVYRAQTGQTR